MSEYVVCNLCGFDDVKKKPFHSKMLRLPQGFHVVSCRKCGLRYLSPRPTAEEYIEHYSVVSHYQPESYLSRMSRQISFFNRRLDEIEALGLNPGAILEVGCAAGIFLHTANMRGWKPIGLEISPSLAQYARDHFNLNVLNIDDVRKANFKDEQFDLIYASNIIEHLTDPKAFLQEAYRVLKPKGILFVEVPNQFRHLREKIKIFFYVLFPRNFVDKLLPPPIDSLHHCYFFSPKTIEKVIRKSCFEILSISTYTPDYFRDKSILKRWGGMFSYKVIDNVSIIFKRGLCIKVFANKA